LARIGLVAVAVIVVTAGCQTGSRGGGPGNTNDNGSNVVDRSDFREFRFEQWSALGFCPELDSVYQASIDRQDDGTYTLDMSIIEEGQQGVDACLDDQDFVDVESDCIVVRELPTRSLTEAEVQQVQQVFSTIGSDYYSFDQVTCIDPCLVYWLSWDDVATTPDVAGCVSGTVERLDRDDFAEIAALLEDLRTAD
jgi:hypothetical protein